MPTRLDDLYHNFYKPQEFTKPTTSTTTNPQTSQNGDIRIIDGQKQGYHLGFG